MIYFNWCSAKARMVVLIKNNAAEIQYFPKVFPPRSVGRWKQGVVEKGAGQNVFTYFLVTFLSFAVFSPTIQ